MKWRIFTSLHTDMVYYFQFLFLRNQVIGAEDLLNLLEGDVHLLVGVSGHEAEADERVIGCYSGRNHGVDKDTLVQQVARDGKRLVYRRGI